MVSWWRAAAGAATGAAVLGLVGALGCGSAAAPPDKRTAATGGGAPSPAVSAAPAILPGAPADTTARPRIVALGDSLTAGLGLPRDQAYPALLQQRLNKAGLGYEVVNAGVSGDTSAGGLRRLDWALDGDVKILIVALGGNDGLRGLPPAELQKNLAAIVERAHGRGVTVILAGMEAPPNYGRDYAVAFHRVYPALAKKYRVALVPFLLQGVAGDDALNQPDGIHPTARGAEIVADNVWTVLEPLIASPGHTGPRSTP